MKPYLAYVIKVACEEGICCFHTNNRGNNWLCHILLVIRNRMPTNKRKKNMTEYSLDCKLCPNVIGKEALPRWVYRLVFYLPCEVLSTTIEKRIVSDV